MRVRVFLHTQQQALIDECGFKTADKYADLREMQDKHNLLSVKPVKLPHRAAQIHTEDLTGNYHNSQLH